MMLKGMVVVIFVKPSVVLYDQRSWKRHTVNEVMNSLGMYRSSVSGQHITGTYLTNYRKLLHLLVLLCVTSRHYVNCCLLVMCFTLSEP